MAPTQITDLSTDCLLAVFKHLGIIDLANLVEANIVGKLGKRNQKKRRYQESIVSAFKTKVKINVWKTIVSVDARSAPRDIKMLRSFGREIVSIYLDCKSDFLIYDGMRFKEKENRRYERALEDVIIGSCSKTLLSMSFDQCNRDTMKELDRPFEMVESVDFYHSHLGSALGHLKKWFPKMVHLNFDSTYVFMPDCIHEHFPNLESLSVSNGSVQRAKKGKEVFSNSNLEIFLQMNPQLKTLSISHDSDVSDGINGIVIDWNLCTLINKNSKLNELKLNLEGLRFEPEWPSTVTIDTLTILDVELSICCCLNIIQITLPRLESLNLTLTCHDMAQNDYDGLVAFVLRAAPKKLNIVAHYLKFDINNSQIIKMMRLLSQLQTLCIECEWFSDTPVAVVDLLANGSGRALQKLIVVLRFDGNDKGDPSSDYLQMRPVLREKIHRNESITGKWSYKFNYMDDDDYYVDSIEFEKIK